MASGQAKIPKAIHYLPPLPSPAYGKETAELVLDIIRTYPGNYNQNSWSSICGTTACVAGWTAIIHGRSDLLTCRRLEWFIEGGISSFAASALGITEIEAERLFLESSEEEAIEWLGGFVRVGYENYE